ncbi:SDR family oxidoreductase [Pandoraea fibrosis]|uniref:SDR family oxidoreductase n=1 Tax=Pandoraea fibrosis TaxID=1891094 RepID=A0ABX6HS23_9BURK|nr:SDR family NAD(P)-dependent oxidoreductase [Pandoraea fibrosis]QHE93089.1 SDR family oxidoreductase [Pandoraea fibrosis]QHF13352.1 SDR family oxidoreductase [Pandoraea fibrosis]
MLLDGYTCVISGAGTPRGIGRATAMLFAQQGARIAVLDLNLADAQATCAILPGTGHKAYACDVRSREQCEAVSTAILSDFDAVDVLINNAGIASPDRFMDIDDATYERVLDINLRGTFFMSQAFVPHFKTRQRGVIVNMSSVAAQRGGGVFGGAHYAASKSGVLGLTKAMARELGPAGIRVNAICPGMIDTDITQGGIPADRRAMLLAQTPLGRAGEASEIAGCCLFLASPLSSYVTGAEIDANGGSHIH